MKVFSITTIELVVKDVKDCPEIVMIPTLKS